MYLSSAHAVVPTQSKSGALKKSVGETLRQVSVDCLLDGPAAQRTPGCILPQCRHPESERGCQIGSTPWIWHELLTLCGKIACQTLLKNVGITFGGLMIVIDLSRANGKGWKKKTWVSTCSKPQHTDKFSENCLNKFITLTFEIPKHISDSFDQRLGIHYRTQSNPPQIAWPSCTWLVKHRLRGLFAQNVIHSGFQIGIDGPCLMASGLSKWHVTAVISLVALQWHGSNESVKNCSWSSCPWQFDQLIRFTWDKTWQNHAYQGLSNTWLTSKKENWQPSTKNHHWLLYLLQAHLGQGIAYLQLWVCVCVSSSH